MKRKNTANSMTTKRQGSMSMQIGEGPISVTYENRGLVENAVDQEHMRVMELEVKRERGVNETLQSDIALLRNQLARADQRNLDNEKVRHEQANNILGLEKVRSELTVHVTTLEQVRKE